MLPERSLIKFSQCVRWEYNVLYTHKRTHTQRLTHTRTFIKAALNEFSLILWFDMYGLCCGVIPSRGSWLLFRLFFLAFYLFQLWKLFTRVAKTKARINKRKAWKRLLLLLSWLVYNYPGFLLPLFTQIFPLLPSFLASSKQTFTAQLFLERSFVVNWWVLNCFVGPMNILWYTSFTFTFHFPIFFGRFSTLLLKFMHNQQS